MSDNDIQKIDKLIDSLEKFIESRVALSAAAVVPKVLWTVDECSHATGYSLTKLNEWIRDEKIPVVRIVEPGNTKGTVRIPVKEFELWIRSHTKRPA